MSGQLFNPGPAKIQAGKKKTLGERQKDLLANGIHPLTRRPLGPMGVTCKECAYAVHIAGGNRNYWKCRATSITHGAATDLRLSWPACASWVSSDYRAACDNPDCENGRVPVKNPAFGERTREMCSRCQGFGTMIQRNPTEA